MFMSKKPLNKNTDRSIKLPYATSEAHRAYVHSILGAHSKHRPPDFVDKIIKAKLKLKKKDPSDDG